MSTILSFKSIENKHDVCRGRDCFKKFCESLREQAMKIISKRNTILSFKSIENKHDVYRGRDCFKKFCESLREQAMKIIPKKNNEVINKLTKEIISKCNNLLNL